MACSIEIVNKIKSFFDKNDWTYTFDEKKEEIRIGFNVSEKFKSIKIIIDLSYDDCYVVISPFPINVGTDRYEQVLRTANYINYKSKFGNYELSEKDGELRYRMTVDCEGIVPSDGMIERIILIPIIMTKKYGECFIDIIVGNKSFEEVKSVLEK